MSARPSGSRTSHLSSICRTRLFFKKHTNLSYITYLNGLRISKACRELESTAMSVSEICWDCGFNNKSNFNRLFLQAKGMTPTAYRNYISKILV